MYFSKLKRMIISIFEPELDHQEKLLNMAREVILSFSKTELAESSEIDDLVFFSEDNVYIFFKKDADLKIAGLNGDVDKIKSKVISTLMDMGFGDVRDTMLWVFDTDESVQRDWEGNYLNQLRGE